MPSLGASYLNMFAILMLSKSLLFRDFYGVFIKEAQSIKSLTICDSLNLQLLSSPRIWRGAEHSNFLIMSYSFW